MQMKTCNLPNMLMRFFVFKFLKRTCSLIVSWGSTVKSSGGWSTAKPTVGAVHHGGIACNGMGPCIRTFPETQSPFPWQSLAGSIITEIHTSMSLRDRYVKIAGFKTYKAPRQPKPGWRFKSMANLSIPKKGETSLRNTCSNDVFRDSKPFKNERRR